MKPWVYPYSFPHKESSHLQDSNQTMCEKSDPALFCTKASGLPRHGWLWSWEDSGELTSDESSEKNDEGSDDPEYDPKFLH